jgi:hypothetical protein
MPENIITVEQLRGLIGQHLNYHGVVCQIIEVLDDGQSLALQESTAHTIIQSDQYGEAHRRVAPTFTILVWDSTSGKLNPALTELLEASS